MYLRRYLILYQNNSWTFPYGSAALHFLLEKHLTKNWSGSASDKVFHKHCLLLIQHHTHWPVPFTKYPSENQFLDFLTCKIFQLHIKSWCTDASSEQPQPAPVCSTSQTFPSKQEIFTEFSCHFSDVKKFQLTEHIIKQESHMTHHFISWSHRKWGFLFVVKTLRKFSTGTI